jgi:hypothetical protein
MVIVVLLYFVHKGINTFLQVEKKEFQKLPLVGRFVGR